MSLAGRIAVVAGATRGGGRAVAARAADPDVAAGSGQVLSTWALAADYGFTDADDGTPNWGAHAAGADFGAAQKESHERFLAGFTAYRP